jgi:hypothetical protein
MPDHSAALTELLGLVDERFKEAIRAAIADIGRLDKVERMGMCIDSPGMGMNNWLVMSDNGDGLAATLREAIDGVPE